MKALWIAVIVALSVPCARAQQPLPLAPFQVESSVLLPTTHLPGEPRLRIAVDLGAAELRPAITEQGAAMIVLYEFAALPAELAELRKSCSFICGYAEEETCHWQALLAPEPDARFTGEPLAALPGGHRVEGYQPLSPQPAGPIAWSGAFARPIWPPQDPSEFQIQEFDAASGRLRASLRLYSGEVKAIADEDCRATETAGLVALACPNLSVLAERGVPLLVSWTDYDEGVALPLARMRIDGRQALLVRFSTKGEVLHGLLVREGGRWVPLFRPADYPTLC